MSTGPNLIATLGGLTALTAFAMAYVLIYLVNGVSIGANDIDLERTKKAVQAMMSGAFEQTSGLIADNAKWDDAAANAYGEADPQWLFETWGNSTADQNYDVSYIIDDAGKTIAGFSDGEVLKAEAREFLGPSLNQLTADLPKDGETFATAVGILKTAKGVAIVSAAPILPFTEGKTIHGATPRILIFSKTLTPEYVAALGKRLILEGLEIVPTAPEQSSFIPLNGISGTSIGYLKWIPDRPGDKAKAVIQAPAIIAVSAMMACMLLLIFVSARLSSGLQRSGRKAWKIANTDALTSLPNRHAALNLLQTKIASLKSSDTREVTVMLADLDGFKVVNDAYGHQIGDQLLKGVSAGLAVVAAKYSASLSRLGGDEFAFILDGEHATARAEDISSAVFDFLEDPFNIDGRIARVGTSIGLAVSAENEIDGTELLRRADVAMYTAKVRGKGQLCLYGATLDAARNSRIEMAERLRDALAKQQIEVAYQPIVEADSRQISGVEALARWQLPDGQWVPPDMFISVAEEFGLIDKLGNQVLGIACREAVSWTGINLSVNVSPVQFRNPNFVDNITGIVDQSGLARDRLELEVTEGYMIENRDNAKPIIDKLRSQGFQVSLDDFGSGYSSIGYLREFDFDKLKIDKSLIHGMIADPSARSIILAIASLTQSMNMTVTAEGVELEEEADLLRLAGCNTLQGYHFGRPQTAQSLTALLVSQQPKLAVA